ncbi:MAG: hypothetical protein ACI4LB_04490 [Candidatus Fimenecus sp.]
MKQQLKDNRGVALSMVMILLSVMTVLGGVIYAYTMQSLKTLQFGTDRQKAEYLARSGIEASVFMYQDAMLKYNDVDEIKDFIDASHDDGNDSTDETITTNWVYLLKDGSTYVDGGSGDEPTPPAEDYIGYYRVTITNDQKKYEMPNGSGSTEVKTEYIKRFTSVGYCGDSAATKKAYIVPLVDITGKGWIASNGVIQLEDAVSDETSIIATGTISIDCGLIDDLLSSLRSLFDPEGKYINGRIKNQPLQLGCTSGNMVIAKPEASDSIRFASDGKDHISGFISLSNLFVECDIDVEPERTHFNALYLRGNEIVIDGEINMYVYDPGTNNANSLTSAITGIAQKIARNYRYSTVVLGTPSTVATSVADPLPTTMGGLGECGKVYFGGDVYVNLISRTTTRKYKVFSAGDICYFDGDFEMQDEPYGVDLLKYFLDTAIEEGNYSSTVLRQFERTRQFYYPDATEQETYSNDQNGTTPPSMRKIDIEKNKPYDTIVDTVLPSAGDASYIIWE